MKRTALKRSGPIARRTPVRKKRAAPRRVSVLRDRAYLNWLRERKCVVGYLLTMSCALRGSDPAHGPVNGRGSKGPDNEAIPLCRHHHEEQHRLGWPAFCEKYGIDRAAIAATLYAAYLDTVR